MRKAWLLLPAVVGLVCWSGCVSVKAPREVNVGGSSRPEPVDSGRVPQTASHSDCQDELYKAYQNIQYLEKENARLSDKAAEYKKEREKAERERDKYKDRLEKYEDD